MKHYAAIIYVLLFLSMANQSFAYPLDAYPETGIRRIEAAHLAVLGKMPGLRQPPGALLPTSLVDLRLLDYPELILPKPDPEFTARVRQLLGDKADRYGVAILDLSNPDDPRYAEHRAEFRQNVGSVGKIAVALAVFQSLADIYPDDIKARKRLLRETVIIADEFIQKDHHKVRIWNPDTRTLDNRKLQQGDRGSLWEFLDWTLSVSSNAAASMVMKHAMLLRYFGRDYPVSIEQADRFFSETARKQLRELYEQTFLAPLTRNGLDLRYFRQGSFFTRYGKQRIPTGYNSYGTARELMRLLLLMEQGRLVDLFSSREIKRLLYMTERRIRYASSPVLRDSAIYFKSGSLYSCKIEPGFKCKPYHGNVKNYMNSVAIVETPAGVNRLFYLSTLISNMLYKNAAVAHQTLATSIHGMIEERHPPQATLPGQVSSELTFGLNLIGFTEKQEERMHIAKAQAILNELGYSVGKIDGKLGPKTAKAIKAFQEKQHIPVDGKVTENLLDQLKVALGSLPPTDPSQPDRAAGQ
jgi:Putative peptidoglycan binding domain